MAASNRSVITGPFNSRGLFRVCKKPFRFWGLAKNPVVVFARSPFLLSQYPMGDVATCSSV